MTIDSQNFAHDAAERVYRAWDDALGRKDLDAALDLYAPEATIESPLVRRLLGSETGVCKGHAELRRFIDLVFRHTPPIRRRFRTAYFTDGKRLMWEYPREAPDGPQMDFVEVMELDGQGCILHHRVYWGWFGLSVLDRGEYRRE